MMTTKDFYRDPNVIRRILEYCGVPAEETRKFSLEPGISSLQESRRLKAIASQMSVEYVSGWGDYLDTGRGKKWSSRRNWQLGELLDGEVNLFRSVWDKQKVTFLLDVEYVSNRYPGESYLNQEKTFWKLEPVYNCVLDVLGEYGIKPLTLVTGQGYHFVFDIESYEYFGEDGNKTVTPAATSLVNIGALEETLRGKYEHLVPGKKRSRPVERELGRAFDATGKILEYVVHKIMNRAGNYGVTVPLAIGDIVAGNPMQETINLDLSTYASPLYNRVMRTAFSIHNKHHDKKKDVGARHIPVQIAIPRYTPCNGNTLSLDEVFANRRHFQNSANYAAAITLNVPTFNPQVSRLIEEYKRSSLYQFHQDFDRTACDKPEDWARTYDAFDSRTLPPCVAEIIRNPNPSLLQPTQIQTLVRVLTGKQWWHPKHVAGLIRSKYERDHHWSYGWHSHDANHHANTWVRFYAGLLATGIDQRTDQNCVSHQEKDLCIQPFCGYDLGKYR